MRNQLILIGIVLLAFILRLYKVNNPIADWHSWRQADTAAVSRNYLKYGIDLLHPRFDDLSNIPSGLENPQGYRFVEFPISNAFHAVLGKAFPSFNFEVLGRLISVFYSLISILLLYFLVRVHLGVVPALLSCFVFAILPFNIYFSRTILPEPLIVTVSLAALLTTSYWIKKTSPVLSFFIFLFFSLLLLLKAYMAVFFVPAIVLTFTNRKLTSRLLILLAISFLPFLAWFTWAKIYPEGIPLFKWVFNGDHIRFRPAWFYWIFGIRIGTLILGVWGVFLFSLGVLQSGKSKYLFLLSWLAAILIYVTVVATANVRHDYYQVIATPMVAVFVALGFIYLWRDSLFGKLLGLFSLFLMLVISAKEVQGFYQINHWEIVEAGQAADKILPATAKVIAPYNGDTAFLYQINRPGWPYVTGTIDELVHKGATHYVSVNFDDLTNQLMSRYPTIAKTDKYVILDLTRPK